MCRYGQIRTCPELYGYRFMIAYTSAPRATISPSSSVSVGATQNGQPWSAPGPVGFPAPWIYASRCGVHNRPNASGTPAPGSPSGGMSDGKPSDGKPSPGRSGLSADPWGGTMDRSGEEGEGTAHTCTRSRTAA